MESTSYSSLRKAKSDKNEYLLRVLPNGLKVMIIFDAEANKSAASMTVRIGSLSDPKELPGLAHFCEHMLFMGTEKYPDEKDFIEFINKNGGNRNAFTDLDCTQYYFDIGHEHFNIAIDRFAQFYIKPLFNQDTVDRELKAIDSENSKNLLLDEWRSMQLLRSEAVEASCFNRFATGNYEVLNKPNVRDELLAFHSKLYSSEVMGLAIISNQPIEVMSKMIEDVFSLVPKREGFGMPKYDLVQPYDGSNLGYLYKVVPIKDQDKLVFNWFFPFLGDAYKKKPLSFWSSILGHEGPNSLTLSLCKDDLINSLVTMDDNKAQTFSTLRMALHLTKKGLDQYEEVIRRVFKFIAILQKEKISRKYFNEVQKIWEMMYETKSKSSSLSTVITVSSHLNKYANEDILTGAYLIEDYDEALLEKCLMQFTKDNCLIFLSTQKYKEECVNVERWYESKFTKAKIVLKPEEVEAHECKHPLGNPPENPFIPDNLDLIAKPEEILEYPAIVFQNEQITLWHKQDTTFNLPKGVVKCRIHLDKDINNKTVRHNLSIVSIVNTLITNELRDIVYLAEEANLHFSVCMDHCTVVTSMAGFSHSMKAAIKILYETFKKIDYSTKAETMKVQIQQQIQNTTNYYFRNSYVVCSSYAELILLSPSLTPSELLEEYLNQSEMTLDNLVKFTSKALSKARYEWLIQGNISKEDAIEMVNTCNAILQPSPLEKDRIAHTRCVQIPKNTQFIYQFNHPNPDEANSSILSHYQCGRLSQKEVNIALVLESLLKEKFSDELRTKQGLCYVVFLFYKEYNGVQGINCLVQSNVKCPEYISEQITLFFEAQAKMIAGVTDEEFQTHVNAILDKKKKKDENVGEEAIRNYGEIITHRYEFNRKKVDCELLAVLKKEEIINFYMEHFVHCVKRLDVEYVAKGHLEENEKKLLELNAAAKGVERIKVSSFADFKVRNSLYPDYYNINIK